MATPVGNGAPGAVVPAGARPPAAPSRPGAAVPRPGGAPANRLPSALTPSGVKARLARATRTAPGRLRLAGAVLAVLTAAFGGLTAWQLETRAQAAERVVSYSQPLSQAAADIHRSLADADTTAATGFLLAGAEPKTVRDRYEQDLSTAARLVAEAAARTTASSPAQGSLARLNQQLPVYAGLVESARADNRQGFPLGGAYLRYASDQMRTVLLPAAAELTAAENQELADDYAEAKAAPWGAYLLAVVTIGALVWVQVVLYRRTNRVFNVGLLGATAAVLAGTLWLGVTSAATGAALKDSDRDGATPLRALNTARVDVLTARLAENLHYVARGSTAQYAELWTKTTEHLSKSVPKGTPEDARSGSLPEAFRLAPPVARVTVADAAQQYDTWHDRHDDARKLEIDNADYQGALDETVTAEQAKAPNTADASFNATDQQLAKAAGIEQQEFHKAADGTDGDLRTAAVSLAVLGLVAAAAALRGLGRRLAEYR
ncbi:hypothetical protein F7Q99_19325 [Streptomyces kaniharaensis]|uniref:Secreted protein n=1 Tax=Streptomyces kaniharaensis TaxID=212423 RepID=A0A6N7KVL8_9ACTN|nr:hypothetical protein [Streptomyces kaniharaensis]MQS14357.1 hypothetical protein [Streptomyces kaniharaensis]